MNSFKLGNIPWAKINKFVHVRRTIGYLLTVLLTGLVSYQLAWHPEVRGKIFVHPAATIAFIACAITAAILLVWALIKPSKWNVGGAFILGVVAALFGKAILSGMSAGSILGAILLLLVLVVLWAASTWKNW